MRRLTGIGIVIWLVSLPSVLLADDEPKPERPLKPGESYCVDWETVLLSFAEEYCDSQTQAEVSEWASVNGDRLGSPFCFKVDSECEWEDVELVGACVKDRKKLTDWWKNSVSCGIDDATTNELNEQTMRLLDRCPCTDNPRRIEP